MPTDSSSSSCGSSSPVPPGGASSRENSTFNQAQLEDIEIAEDIVGVVREEPYRTELARREITAPVVDALADLCLRAPQRTSCAVQGDTAGETQTLNAEGHERQIVIALEEMQAAAKQKYARQAPLELQNYFIGERLNPNERTLHQNAFTVADRLTPEQGSDLSTALDKLPGITLAKINHLRTLIGLPVAPVAGPSSSSSVSSSSSGSGGAVNGIVPENAPADRAERDRLIREINDRRMEIQLAGDAEYPYTDPAHITARRALHLPTSRPFNG